MRFCGNSFSNDHCEDPVEEEITGLDFKSIECSCTSNYCNTGSSNKYRGAVTLPLTAICGKRTLRC